MPPKPKILVVDDEGIIAMALQVKLQDMGYDVPVTADSGEEALKHVAALKPNLVLLDIHLGGGIDGVTTAEQINREFGTPVVYLTAFSDEETLQRAKLTHPYGYILKPVADRELRIVVEMALYNSVTAEALRRSEEHARSLTELNRLKDDFLAVVSHELRTPLTAMQGWANLLSSGQLSPEEQPHAFEVIERNISTQKELIDDLLDVSRFTAGKLLLKTALISLLPIVEAAVDAVRPSARAKNIQLDYCPRTGETVVLADANRLQQIVYNLLTNAIKFTPGGGLVSVSVARRGTEVLITVADNGIGIEAAFLPLVFERFSQADSSFSRTYAGLGIGLSIVKNLVELHGGTVQVESQGKGQGSAFAVTLPVARGAAGTQVSGIHTASDEKKRERLRGLRVLVVDDEPDTRELLAAVLQQHGASVALAGSAREAMQIFEHLRPDVLVSDIGMPGDDGHVLVRTIRARSDSQGGRTPAIAVTALARDVDRQAALSAGFQKHLAKPMHPEDLVAAVAELKL